jgi:hypothetical protein
MTEEPAHPMSSPAPVLAVIAALAILLLGGLMLIDAFWQASGPVTVATPSTPIPPQAQLLQEAPTSAAPAQTPPG